VCPPESSPRSPKVGAGLRSATSKSASNATWCTKPVDEIWATPAVNDYIPSSLIHPITSFTHALAVTRAKSWRRN
jgi:hypothetical protein